MKKNNNLFISSTITVVAYILMLITVASVEKMLVLFLVSLVAYIVGVVLSIAYTVKAFKKDNQSEEISLVVPVTIMLFFSFCPLGCFAPGTRHPHFNAVFIITKKEAILFGWLPFL